jgi:uncharacterized protein (DUF1015 family)
MAVVKPFRAVRPTRDKVHLVASRSYVSYTRPQLKRKLTENPYSFLHIIHPDYSSRKLHKSSDLGKRFQMVKKKFEEFLDHEIFQRDETPCFYIYRQIKNGHPFTGIIGAVAVQDYLDGKVKVHEQTLSKREETFTRYLDETNINAEPVLLMSESSTGIEDIFVKYLDTRAEYDFTTTNKVHHQLWVIQDPKDVAVVEKAYASVPALYIADGHHRSASSARLCEKRKQNGAGQGAHEFCLAYVLDETTVRIYEFNRLVKDLNGMSPEEFVKKLSTEFYVNEAPAQYKPSAKGEFSMYLNKQWYSLNLKRSSKELDAQLLSDKVLGPILGILDLRRDKRIAFMEGPRGMEGLKHAVDKNHFECAFGLFPVSIQELKGIADAHKTMPPKSTWVEPKLRSGLVVYELS